MDNVSSILVAVCGVGVVCCGGAGLALLTLGRGVALPLIAGVLSALRGVTEMPGGPDDQTADAGYDHPTGPQGTRRGLRDRIHAANDEFNRALKGGYDRPAGESGDLPPSRPSLRRPRSAFDNPSDSDGLRRNPGRPRRDTRHSEQHDDEIFGGMFDE
jgi:hypothetical protein